MFKWLKTHKKIVVGVSTVILLALYFIFGRKSSATYTEYQVTTKDLQETVELSGKVNAGSFATLRFPTGGLLTYLGAREGDTVKKYQTLASVDTRQTQKILEQKLNLYAIQRNTFEQTIDDNNNSVPDGDLGNTLKRILAKNQYQLDNAVKDVEYQDLTVKLSRLTSPIAGVLIISPFTVSGVNALPSDTLTVVDPTSLEFIADLDESDLKRVVVGQKVNVTFDAFPDLKVASTVGTISFAPKETSSGTTFKVKITLPESAIKELRLGLNGSASVILQEKTDVLSLPAQAITYTAGKASVLIKKGNKYESKDVELGTQTSSDVEIKSGLQLGDQVYVKK